MLGLKKGIKLTVAAGLLTIILAACSSSGSNSIEDDKQDPKAKVTISALNSYPPLMFTQKGKNVGFEKDILEAIAKEENFEPEFKVMKFDGFIPGLQANQVDIATSVIIREENKKVVDFADVFLTSGHVLVVANNSSIQTLEDLKGKTIVATQGSTTLETAKSIAEKYGAKTKTFKEADALYMDVENGSSDALVLNAPTVEYRLKTDGDNVKFRIVGDYLTDDNHAFAVKKGNTELIKKINAGLKTIKENGKYDEIHAKWFN